MSSKKFLDSKGFTLMEMVVASAIMLVVVAGAFQAYQYFNKQTINEAKKMDDISEFNLLTKDLLSFTEGAGISTFYLNLPIKSTCSNDNEPCVRQLNDQKFVTPTGTLPAALTSPDNTCVQFYKDAKGKLDHKLAYPGTGKTDKIWSLWDIDLTTRQDLYATWPLVDETSPPYMMVKSRDASIYLSMLVRPFMAARATIESSQTQGFSYAFFESNSPKNVITQLVGYPFLIYSGLYTNQYTIQYAEEVVSCVDDRARCINILTQLSPLYPHTDRTISRDSHSMFPQKVFLIKFKNIDFSKSFFKDIVDKQQISNCLSSWGDGKQDNSGSFFPSQAMSVSSTDPGSQINADPANPLFFNKYSLSIRPVTATTDVPKGSWVAMPIDIVTYKVEPGTQAGTRQLVSELWHNVEIKRKIKIHNLKGPFIITRKLGSPEMGLWYNPIKKNP